MIIHHRLKGFFILCFCFVAGNSWVSAQITDPTDKKYVRVCATSLTNIPSAELSVKFGDNYGNYTIRWYIWKNSNWEPFSSTENKPTFYAYESGEYRCVAIKAGISYYALFSAALYKFPTVSPIIARSTCEGGTLEAEVKSVVFNDDSEELTYVWKLGNRPPEPVGSITPGQVPKMSFSNVTMNENTMPVTLTVTNSCGSTPVNYSITVRPTPAAPTFHPPGFDQKQYYCLGDQLSAKDSLKIVQQSNRAVWYTVPGGTPLPKAPVPDTSIPSSGDSHTWWVLQRVTNSNTDPDYGLTCESPLTEAKVTVLPLSNVPAKEDLIPLCLFDPEITLNVSGDNIKWYNQAFRPLSAAPQINTSLATDQIYYVSQTEANKCESPIENGKITVRIRDRAKTEDIGLDFISRLCPNESTSIKVTSINPQITNPVFKWYANSNKTGLIVGSEIENTAQSSILTTPSLKRDTVFYVTLEYTGVCESTYPRTAMVYVGDIELPYFTEYLPHFKYFTPETECRVPYVEYRPSVSDNCTPSEKLKVYIDPITPTYFSLGDTTLVWYVEDDAANKVYALQSISVIDTIMPRGNCPQDMIWYVDESETFAIVNYDLKKLYSDNCGAVTFERRIQNDSINIYNEEWEGTETGRKFHLGTTNVTHYISDKSGNIRTCSFNIIVKFPDRKLDVRLTAKNNPICSGQELEIISTVSGGQGYGYVYDWKPRAWSEAVFIDYPLENTTYELTVSDGINSLTKSIPITVLKTREVKLELKDANMNQIFEDQIFEGDNILVEATYGFSSYKMMLNNRVLWETGLNNRVNIEAELGTYIVKTFATDENFCVSQDQLKISVDSRKLPNAFTPNSSDGKNRLFLEGFDLEVYTRSGIPLYKGFDGWNGYYKGKLMPRGSYPYVVTRVMNNGEKWVFKGVVTLK